MTKHSRSKIIAGAGFFFFGTILSVGMYLFAYPNFDLKEYVGLLSIPALVSVAFVGFSLVLEGYFEEKQNAK